MCTVMQTDQLNDLDPRACSPMSSPALLTPRRQIPPTYFRGVVIPETEPTHGNSAQR